MITAAPNAPEGLVTTLSPYSVADFTPDSAVLCRNGAPLIAFAFALLRRNTPCHILGKDIMGGLTRLLDKVTAESKELTLQRLGGYAKREQTRLLNKGKRQEAANSDDRCHCLQIFLEQSSSVADAKRRIEQLFEGNRGVTLATVHKSKGLEWPTVFILDRFTLMPSRYATQQWEKDQERNLLYVAITRAKHTLYYIKTGDWR